MKIGVNPDVPSSARSHSWWKLLPIPLAVDSITTPDCGVGGTAWSVATRVCAALGNAAYSERCTHCSVTPRPPSAEPTPAVAHCTVECSARSPSSQRIASSTSSSRRATPNLIGKVGVNPVKIALVLRWSAADKSSRCEMIIAPAWGRKAVAAQYPQACVEIPGCRVLSTIPRFGIPAAACASRAACTVCCARLNTSRVRAGCPGSCLVSIHARRSSSGWGSSRIPASSCTTSARRMRGSYPASDQLVAPLPEQCLLVRLQPGDLHRIDRCPRLALVDQPVIQPVLQRLRDRDANPERMLRAVQLERPLQPLRDPGRQLRHCLAVAVLLPLQRLHHPRHLLRPDHPTAASAVWRSPAHPAPASPTASAQSPCDPPATAPHAPPPTPSPAPTAPARHAPSHTRSRHASAALSSVTHCGSVQRPPMHNETYRSGSARTAVRGIELDTRVNPRRPEYVDVPARHSLPKPAGNSARARHRLNRPQHRAQALAH